MEIKPYLWKLRERIEKDHFEFHSLWPFHKQIEFIDEFLNDENRSDLEKGFFLILNQFPSDHSHHIIVPNEMVLVQDIYDLSAPGIQYEIDFALYGGSIDSPVKVAIECDGLRSHGQKYKKRDRRKEVNLQAAGWIVMRFNSKEIQTELLALCEGNEHVSGFLLSIENTIREKMKVIDHESYYREEYRSKLTGYKWGYVNCTECGNYQLSPLNKKRLKCYKCKSKFTRKVGDDEKIKYEHKGILYFE